jgi:hypothetical protein
MPGVDDKRHTAIAESLLVSCVLHWSMMKKLPQISKRHGCWDENVKIKIIYIHKKDAEALW